MSKKESIIANYVGQLVAQGYDKEAAEEEANRLYVSMYGEEPAAEQVVEVKVGRTNKPIKADA